MPEREGLIARIRSVRRQAAAGRPDTGGKGTRADDRVRSLEARTAHLEQLIEGLQDSVHRESERLSKLVAELQAEVRPEAMGAALAKDARNRGL